MSADIFRHADASLKTIEKEMGRAFQDMGTHLGFDEMDALAVRAEVREVYEKLDAMIRREYRKIAREAYRDACKEAGYSGRFADGAFVNGLLKAYDPLSEFIYTREWTRKRDRLFEALLSVKGGNQEMRAALKRALNVTYNQVRQYADNVTARARVYAFRQAGIDAVVWVTEKDEKVCEVCAPRDEQVYPIELLPEWPAHWHCRCKIEIVDMEERKKRGRWVARAQRGR